MRLSIRLLGRPTILAPTPDEGQPRRLAGQKPWALLAYILLEPNGATRRALAELLWPEADDPFAATRWAILQVRRAIEPWATLEDIEGRLKIATVDGSSLEIDAVTLLDGRFGPSVVEDLVAGDLLEGMTYPDAPPFEDWLLLQRARTSSAGSAALRWAAVVLARSDPARAIALVDRALAIDPYDDAANELGIRIEAERGAPLAAQARLSAAERRYRTELGVDPPETLRRPLERPSDPMSVSLDTTARALFDAARARLDAGDYEAAIDAARRAASAAAATDDDRLEAESLAVLAGVLIHSVRGRDREAVGLLDRALELATTLGDERLAAEVERELGYVAFLAARYGAAESILARSAARATLAGDAAGTARALTILGACRSDRADFAAAETTLTDALARLRGLGDRWEPYAASFLARVRLRTHHADEAGAIAGEATERSRQVGWLSLVPWLMSVAGEAQLDGADPGEAGRTFSTAYALATEMDDPCWRAFALRGLGLVAVRDGDAEAARRLLTEAAEAARSLPDIYAWAEAVALTDLVELEGGRDATRHSRALEITRRGPMPDLVARLSAVGSGRGRSARASNAVPNGACLACWMTVSVRHHDQEGTPCRHSWMFTKASSA